MIRCMKHYVTNGTVKARVRYSNTVLRADGATCVTLYAKSLLDDSDNLADIFADRFQNDSDSRTDYYEKTMVRLYPTDGAIYEQAKAHADAVEAKWRNA